MIDLIEPRFDAHGNSNYHPEKPGLHLCGICEHPDGIGDALGEQPYTAMNLRAHSDAEALHMWHAARAEAELPNREGEDFLCDLNTREGHVDDFSTNRQMLPRLIAAALAAQVEFRANG
ncbi:hypothetical protein OMP43_21700 [Sphingomonas sp. CBMAI 2297]|uniref:hypothetical protein n=1 Tax=Sphingomonas sp. CBMAI 2297 TaxID=2991720 RepID=UPI002455A49C|nr:hypothetical protein [Sphingomonas sp. CBMAI 2297]MDH4746645.1 hypothetical protein [Sphingomonas sp. CBMAI 2297]